MGKTWRHGSPGKKKSKRGYTPDGGKSGYNFGHEFEDRVENVLRIMAEDKTISSFVRYPPNTPIKDFAVIIGGVKKDINITISFRAWNSHYERFWDKGVEIMLFSPKVSDDEIKSRILGIFS